MKPERQEYEGHPIELREREGEFELRIDDVPVGYGQHPDGMYFLHEYAYDPTDNLMGLAQKFINYRSKADQIRRDRESEKGGK
ncbi:MAG: twin-arginine translocation pathway signal protein [Pseudonocardiales bacterium]|nr:MAG: twin-arginine translocation pathway signal protein [Pseudonocardiales bacterium]